MDNEIIETEEMENNNEITEEKVMSKEEYIEKLNNDLEEQKQKTDEYFERLKRNMAEFDNYKKRVTKEKESMYYVVTSDVVANILPILDNFEKALNSKCKDDEYKNGMNMIYTELVSMLDKLGVKAIETIGKTFDPNFHEAVMHEEDDSKGEKEITEEFRKGYMLKDKVIRHSMVKVAN